MTVRGTAQGTRIDLESSLPFPNGQLVSVDVQALDLEPVGTPARLLDAMRRPPHIATNDIAELELLIELGCGSRSGVGEFDDIGGPEQP